jgi:hypothetical protein
MKYYMYIALLIFGSTLGYAISNSISNNVCQCDENCKCCASCSCSHGEV